MKPVYAPYSKDGWKTVQLAIREWGMTLRLVVILISGPFSALLGAWLLTR